VLRAAVGLFLYQLGIVLVIVAAIAAIWALGYGGPFVHAYGTACLVFGCLALLFGAFGLNEIDSRAQRHRPLCSDKSLERHPQARSFGN
jgi:hypothetical protein